MEGGVRIPVEFNVDGLDYSGTFTTQPDGSLHLTCSGYYYGKLWLDSNEEWDFEHVDRRLNWRWRASYLGLLVVSWVESNAYFMR